MLLRPEYLSQKLDRPLPTKDGGILRTIRDACDYMTGMDKKRELRTHWQRCCTSTTLRIFCFRSRSAPEFSPRREAHSVSLIGVGGDLHGRNAASALMRSRLRNRTRLSRRRPYLHNGGEPLLPVLPRRAGGALSKAQRTI
jgi:hypothetical protein